MDETMLKLYVCMHDCRTPKFFYHVHQILDGLPRYDVNAHNLPDNAQVSLRRTAVSQTTAQPSLSPHLFLYRSTTILITFECVHLKGQSCSTLSILGGRNQALLNLPLRHSQDRHLGLVRLSLRHVAS